MNRKLDLPILFLFTALLFGAVFRFVPAISNGFPLNDGGMFYTMIGDLKANHFILPQFTTYNYADIPFAYPPLGFYIGAIFSGIFPISVLQILLWLPALVNTFSIFVFYKLAEQILPSRTTASLAVLVYALASRSFVWQVMGGGITRAFGLLFLLLMLWQCVQLFKEYSYKKLLLTILFGACAVLSHPQTALHAILGGISLFLFYSRNKRGFVSSLIVGTGVLLLTAPWWVTVLSRYGIAPMFSAGQTSQRTIESYLALLKFEGLGDYLFIPTLLIAFVGIWVTIKQREFFLLVWTVLAYLIDPRGGEGIALLAISMLAGVGLLKLSALISRSDGQQAEGVMMKRASQALVFGMAFYFILTASVSDFQLLNTSLKPEGTKLFGWINTHVSDGKTFLLSTGREFSMSDPMQEWFPALTKQRSATTLQGLEWTLNERFFPWQKQLAAFQYCADMDCVNKWSQANGVDYDYLVVMIPPKYNESNLGESLRGLALSARSSSLSLVYESENALVFEVKK